MRLLISTCLILLFCQINIFVAFQRYGFTYFRKSRCCFHKRYSHPEQRTGYVPPEQLKPDGHLVDELALQDLIDDGTLKILRRRPDYTERRTDGYVEPEVVYLIGTSHISEASAEDVKKVIEVVQPQGVVVELCRSRAGMLSAPVQDKEKNQQTTLLGLAGGGNVIEEAARSIKLGGQSSFVLRALLDKAVKGLMIDGDSDKAVQQPVAVGVDFQAANAAAEQIGAEIILGDRPIEITLKRAFEALSLVEKGKVFAGLLFGSLGLLKTSDELNGKLQKGVPEDDLVDQMAKELSNKFPSLVGPLITERDMYLSWSLKRSRAVCGKLRIVGVVGKGHMVGIEETFKTDNGGNQLIFKELTKTSTTNNKQSVSSLVLRIIFETIIGYVLFELWQKYNQDIDLSTTLNELFSAF